MSRGVLVLDLNVHCLESALLQRNIHIIQYNGRFVQEILVSRIIVTTTSADFIKLASSFDMGILDLNHLNSIDEGRNYDNTTASLISDAIIDFELWSIRHYFILKLQNNEKHEYSDLID